MADEVVASTQPATYGRTRTKGAVGLVLLTTAWSAWWVVQVILWGHTTVLADGVVVASWWSVRWGMLLPAAIALMTSVIAAIHVLAGRPRRATWWLVAAGVASAASNLIGTVLALVTLVMVLLRPGEDGAPPPATAPPS